MDLVNATREWLAGKISSPGMTAEPREISRIKSGGRLEVKYQIYLKGASKDQTYSLIDWPANKAAPSETLAGISLLENGLAVCAGRTDNQCGDAKKLDDPVDFTFYPLEGELYRMALISDDQKAKVFFTMVPVPNIKRDKNCTLEVMRLTSKYEIVLVRGRGFQPNEDLQLDSNSSGELRGGPGKADEHGDYVTGLLPFVKGKDRGTTEVKLRGANCAPVLTFTWGN
jgi:hypothetical protein